MNPELLLDVAKLLRKYPPDVWEDLLRDLNSPSFRDGLFYVLEGMRKLSYESRSGYRQTESLTTDDMLFRRALLLNQTRVDLQRRRIAEIRDYAESLAVSFDRSTSRETLIRKILKVLEAKDIGEIEKTRIPTLFGRPVTQDYERWGELIMGRKDKPKR